MSITGDYNLYNKYQQPAFGSLTAQGGARTSQGSGFSQVNSWEGVPNTTPQVVGAGLLQAEDYELAQGVIDSGLGVQSTYRIGAAANPYAANGASWEGFSVPEKTGNGELPPPVMTGSGIGDKFDSQRWLEEQFQI